MLRIERMGMGSNSSVEREDKIVTEVLVVLGELGRGDLVEGLKEVIEGWPRERKELLRTLDILEGVINNEK
jgi:hypothetical protein